MRYTILTLPHRVDRHFIATTQALSVGVPESAIHYYRALDTAQTGATTRAEIVEAAIADGFPFFERLSQENVVEGKIFYIWNLSRFCRDIIEDRQITFFIHDGSKIRNYDLYGDLYSWLLRTWRILEEKTSNPITLSTTHLWQQYIFGSALETVEGTFGFVLKGLFAPDTWGRIYTPQFAEFMLNRLETFIHEIGGAPQFQILFGRTQEDIERVHTLPGAYSGLVGFSRDTPMAFLGTDSGGNHPGYTEEYERLYGEVNDN